MPGMLFQIERRLAEFAKKGSTVSQKLSDELYEPKSSPAKAKPKLGKTVGVQVPPELYEQLEFLCKTRGLKSIKAALLAAAEAGIEQLVIPAPKLATNTVAEPHGNKFTASDL